MEQDPRAPEAPTRVAADSKGPRAQFDDIEVGRVLGEMEWVVTEEMIDTQCAIDADYDVWYSLESPWGGRIAPPQISYRPPRWLLSRTFNVRGLFYRWEMENLRPIRPGVTMRVSARISDKYLKNEREFIVYESEARDPEGNVVFRTKRTHVLDFIDRSAQRAGEGIDSDITAERI